MATETSIEQRLAAVEKELAALKARIESIDTVPAKRGVEAFIGAFENNPAFAEAMEYVRQAREADRLQENGTP